MKQVTDTNQTPTIPSDQYSLIVPKLFNHKYYLQQLSALNQHWPNLKDSDLINHYCSAGWKAGLNPSKLFNTNAYLKAHPEFKKSGSINPLEHWLRSGSNFEDLGMSQNDFLESTADQVIRRRPGILETHNRCLRVAVVLHVFYADQLASCIDALAKIPSRFDIYVSTTYQLRNIVKANLTKLNNLRQQSIEVFPNVGRDIAPFIIGFAAALQNYDIALKIHTKKSTHDLALNDWLTVSLYALTGSESIIKEHWKTLKEPTSGLTMPPPIWPIAYSIAKDSSWGYLHKNYHRCSRERERLNLLDLDPTESFSFPAGSMFWLNPLILKPMIDLNLRWSSFDREAGQIDGTLAHSIERLIGLVCTRINGMKCTSIWPSQELIFN